MDITADTLTRLGAKLDACDLTDDEHTALIALLTPHHPDNDADEVAGFVSDAHDKYANQEVSYLRSVSFGELLPRLGPPGPSGTNGF